MRHVLRFVKFEKINGDEALLVAARGATLHRTTCMGHLKQLMDKVQPADKWQLAEWYDQHTCDFFARGRGLLSVYSHIKYR